MKKYWNDNYFTILLIFLFGIGTTGLYAQESKSDSISNILIKSYQTKDTSQFKQYIHENIEKFSTKLIRDLSIIGMKERNETLLNIAFITALEKKNDSTLALVYFNIGDYFHYIGDNKYADKYYNNALNIYQKLNDLIGQGNVYSSKGEIFYSSGKNDEANIMYDKALPYFEQANFSLGLGNVYSCKGDIFFSESKNNDANAMYDKALPYFEQTKDLLGLGNIYIRKGEIYYNEGRNDDANLMFDKALPYFEQANTILSQGNIYTNKGDIYFTMGKYDEAFKMYDKALPFYEQAKEPIGQGNIYKSEGYIFETEGKNDDANKMYDKALIFYEQANEPIGQGNIYKNKGNIYFREGKNDEAKKMYDKALPFYELAKEPIGQGNINYSKGNVFYFEGNNDEADKLYDKALPFFEQAKSPINQGNIYYSKGNIYLREGKDAEANKMYDKALPFYELAQSPICQGGIYCNKGDICFREGNRDEANIMYDKALSFYKQGKTPIGQGDIYIKKGEAFLSEGKYDDAFRMFDKALPLYEQAQSPIGQGNVYYSKGKIYYIYGKYDDANLLYDKALKLYEYANNPVGQGNVYYSKGKIAYAEGKNNDANLLYNKALAFFEQLRDPIGQGDIYQRKGDIFYKNGDYKNALQMFDKALELYNKVDEPDNQASALLGKARIYKKNDKEKALQCYEQALGLYEKVRNQTGTAETKISYMKQLYFNYEDAILFMLDNGYKEKAFNTVESIRARGFLDQLTENRADIEKGVNPELKKTRDSLNNYISFLTKNMLNEYSKGANDDDSIMQNLGTKIRETDFNLQETVRKIRQSSPKIAAVIYPQPINSNSLQKVLKSGECLLEYFITDTASYCFVVKKNFFKAVRLTFNYSEYNFTLNRFTDAMNNNGTGDIFINDCLTYFYSQLIAPVEEYIKNEKVIISPDWSSSILPFEAFIDTNSHKNIYAIEKFNISYIQSATMLNILRTQVKSIENKDGFIAFGDPVFDYKNFKSGNKEEGTDIGTKEEYIRYLQLRQAKKGGSLIRLIGSGYEVELIDSLFKSKGQKTNIYKRLDASEENAKSDEMSKYGYIHFSTHGIANPNFQGIVLSQNPESKEDGFLSFGELLNCKYNAQLVVLSACQTGLGKLEHGEGVTGLTRAVMSAGSPAALVTLWSVTDVATVKIMFEFYKYILSSGKSKIDALRQVKLDMLKSEKFKQPFFWSPFVMYGE